MDINVNVVVSLNEVLLDRIDKLIYLFSPVVEGSKCVVKQSIKTETNVEPADKVVEENSIGIDKSGEVASVEAKKDTTKYNKDDVIKTLQNLASSKSKQAVKEILLKYGASRVPELKEDDYDAVIKEAEEMI